VQPPQNLQEFLDVKIYPRFEMGYRQKPKYNKGLKISKIITQNYDLSKYRSLTVKKAKRDAGPKHEGKEKFRHSRRTIGKIRQHQRLGLSIDMGDGIFHHPCVVVLRHAWLF
jgi:hypothetical protein